MLDLRHATSPEHNAAVLASAGTGKTWLLVTRIIRLLLAGAHPGSILAITFTRKAAAEMQSRLQERLYALAGADEAQLAALLRELGAPSDAETAARAQRLYETLLLSESAVRVCTFHSFCQELLTRFPLEAGVPPNFELLEQTDELEQAAYNALLNEASTGPDGGLAQALDMLFDYCGGLSGARGALHEFLEHRSDWWAYTEGESDALTHASARLAGQLRISLEPDDANFPDAATVSDIAAYAELLSLHPTVENQAHVSLLRSALDPAQPLAKRIADITQVFFTGKGTARKRKSGKPQRAALGEEKEAQLLALHERLCAKLRSVMDAQARQATYAASRAWLLAGARLLQHYQTIKESSRVLDFQDLEWKAYQLLNDSDHAHWVQYKLDQRIDHLLIDEFQDTNPTQWHFLLPMLQEFAAGGKPHLRSVFLVGDSKQSIYRFRRADARLLHTARDWLENELQAHSVRLDKSWRFAPAIVDFLNRVFGAGELRERLPGFHPHGTHRPEMAGRVEILPLFADPQDTAAVPARELRNPLLQPRLLRQDRRYLLEARAIAQRILSLKNGGIETAGPPVEYGGIIILLRSRVHAHIYEHALREAAIPYQGASGNEFSQSLEVLDMIALLDTLISPYDNLALAQVLRSPLFDCADEELMRIAAFKKSPASWNERLDEITPALGPNHVLARAHAMIGRWRTLAQQIPVHDLLDRVYHEANVVARYTAAFPPHLHTRVRRNLTRFIELALDTGSGRYPSLMRFRERLRTLPTDAAAASDSGQQVRVMTIHAAKGLEAPVIFLADAAAPPHGVRPYRALIDWPSGAPRPAHFLLTGKKSAQDSVTRSLLEQHERAEQHEEANLLYVALTRARRFLFVSGVLPYKGGDLGWYGMIVRPLLPECDPERAALVIES
ncbi:MAG: DNA helicase UvrD [Gammaproteobacteria bacterium]|nr:MAG: DNA helicase UvrD [Gammaproteobacteria bacterium]